MKTRIFLILLFFVLLVYHQSSAQLYLQIEKINSTESIKIGVGQSIIFKAPTYSDQWQRGLIKEIDYESGTIMFDHTFMNLSEITKIKINKGSGEALAWALKGFGVSWLVMGAIIDLGNINDQKALDTQNIIIGFASIGTGVFLDKFAGDKIYTHNKTHRFRLIDLRFSVEE